MRWIVPYPAGGATDLISRLMGQWLTERLGQPVIIDNRPGGGTNIGTQAVVSSPPDGYTLLFTASTHTINVSLQPLPFNFLRDITLVSGLTELPLVMDVSPKLPVKTLDEFVAYAKANPGKVNIASFGAATISHLAIEFFKVTTGVDVVHVPYRGGAQIMADLISGQIQAAVELAAELAAAHQERRHPRARALAAERSPVLPDLPHGERDHSRAWKCARSPASACRAARRPRSSSGSTARSMPGSRTRRSRRASPTSAPRRSIMTSAEANAFVTSPDREMGQGDQGGRHQGGIRIGDAKTHAMSGSREVREDAA